MSTIVYTEDAFLCFYQQIYSGIIPVDDRDHSAIINFHKLISAGDALTENQAKFIIRLLKKYHGSWNVLPSDIENAVTNPRWRQEFRKIDLTKEIFVEVEDNVPWICLKFPYMLKESFEKEIIKESEGFLHIFGNDQYWDKERKIRKLNLYNYNLVQIQDFVQKNGFKIHESFVEAVNLVEDIWNGEEKLTKKSKIIDGLVTLVNAGIDTEEFFEKNQKNFESDLLLAKSMGFIFGEKPRSTVEKIAASEETWFWHRDLDDLVSTLSGIDGKIVFLLDRSSDFKAWLEKFKFLLEKNHNQQPVRICFRLNNSENAEFNTWVKNNGFGGKVDEGKFLIFLQKPNKWLFNRANDVKVVVTNSIYPPNDQIAMYFLQSHPCVIFAGDVKPTDPKGRKIVSV